MLRTLLACAAAFLAACSGSRLDEAEALRAFCERQTELEERCGVARSPLGCADPAWTRTFERHEQGRIFFDLRAASACLDDLRTSCWPISACALATPGAVEPGGACGYDMDCRGEAFCRLGASCPGTCVALPGPGEACVEERCGSEAFCWDGSCVAWAPTGAACVEGSPGAGAGVGVPEPPADPGPAPATCAPGNGCVEGRCTVNRIGPRAREGEVCARVEEERIIERIAACASPLYCSAETGRCTQPGDEGEPCGGGGSPTSPCRDGLVCAAGACTPAQKAGDPCDPAQASRCVGGLACVDGRCAEAPRLGEACVPGGLECTPSAYVAVGMGMNWIGTRCDEESRTCVEAGLHGAPCEDSSACNGICAEGTCRSWLCAP